MKRSSADISLKPHPFSRAYLKEAAAEFTRLRSLTIAALLCALAIAIEKLQIPLAPSLYVSMSFLVIALCSMLTGPLLAVPCGLVVDIVGAIGSGYPFFFGYTLTAVLTAVIYALFLYRARPTFLRLLLMKGCVNLFVNTLLGSLWRVILYHGMPYIGYVAVSGVKNLVFLPLEVFLLCLLFRAMDLPLHRLKFLPPEAKFSYRKKDIVMLTVCALTAAVLLVPFLIWYDEIQSFLKGLF